MYLLNVQSVPEKMIFNLKINRKCKMKFFNTIRLHFRENEFENLYLESQSDWILLSNEFSNFIFSSRKYEKNLFYIFDSFLNRISFFLLEILYNKIKII